MSAQTARGERARLEILSAARTELLESGAESLSLRAVARRAGYAPSALYNHFRDRDQLVMALAIDAVGTLNAALENVAPGPALDRLRALGRAYVTFANTHPQEYRVIFDCLANPPHSWEEYASVAHPFSLIVETCRQGLDEGVLQDSADVGASGLAYALWALVDGHVHLLSKHLMYIDGPFDRMLDTALTALLEGHADGSAS